MNVGTGGRMVDIILIVGTWSGSTLEALNVDKMLGYYDRELQSRSLYILEVIARSHESRMSPARATPNLMK